VKKAEVNSGVRAGLPTEVAEKLKALERENRELRQAMIAFIDDHREAHRVEPICKMLPIAPSVYHDHVAKRRDPSRLSVRAKCDEELRVVVRRVDGQR
jgi:hypothetical protein